jgi:hypothetical protein
MPLCALTQDEERAQPLSNYERSTLDDWIAQYEWKYDVVGTLKGWDPAVLDGAGPADIPKVLSEGNVEIEAAAEAAPSEDNVKTEAEMEVG